MGQCFAAPLPPFLYIMTNLIQGFGDHARFDATITNNKIEFLLVGKVETVVECTFPDGRKRTKTVPNAQIENAILKGSLKAEEVKKYIIQRDEDHKYYSKSHRWTNKIDAAAQFEPETIDAVLAVMADREYKAHKVAV